jgi:putative endonuclease
MHYFYIIYSENVDKYYYGSTHDIVVRLKLHNVGATPSTKGGIPWILIHIEEFKSKTEALRRERQVKKMKSRKFAESFKKK